MFCRCTVTADGAVCTIYMYIRSNTFHYKVIYTRYHLIVCAQIVAYAKYCHTYMSYSISVLFCRASCVSLRCHSHTGDWHGSEGYMDGADTEWCKGVPQLCGQCHKWRRRGSQSVNQLFQCGGWGTDAPHRVQHHCASPHSRRDQEGTTQCTRWDRDAPHTHVLYKCETQPLLHNLQLA